MPVVRDHTALISGASWNQSAGATEGRGLVLTYSLTTSALPLYTASPYYDPFWSAQSAATFRPFNASEAQVVRGAFASWDAVSGIRLIEVPSGLGDINISVIDFDSDPALFGTGVAGLGYYPGYSDDFAAAIDGDIFIDDEYAGDRYVILHEIGHALGLKHPFDDDVTLAADLDTTTQTVMSYSGPRTPINPGPLDVRAIQTLYGAASADGQQAAAIQWDAAALTLTQTGAGGDDVIIGVSVADIMIGGGGNDTLKGMLGDDRIEGGAGADTLHGGGGDDLLLGGEGNDTLYGEAGNDLFIGGLGNDTFIGGDYQFNVAKTGVTGPLSIDGLDIADYSATAAGVTVDLGTVRNDAAAGPYHARGTDIGFDFFGYALDIEGAYGGAGADMLTGSNGDNVLRGQGGADVLAGRGGQDVIIGDGPVLPGDAALSVQRLYLATLGRGPDDGGWAQWSERLEGGTGLAAISQGFVGSAEFTSKYGAGLSNPQFVTLLYQNVFHRNPDAGGLAANVRFLEGGGSRAEVVLNLSESVEFKAQTDSESHVGQVYRLYGATLAREPDAAGLSGWAAALANGSSIHAVANGFVASAEFQQRYGALDQQQFVTLLYQNVLGRGPDAAGLADWLGQLNGGISRTSVVLGFSNSAEYTLARTGALTGFMRSAEPSWNDSIEGGAGNDRLAGGFGADTFLFRKADAAADHIYGYEAWDQLRLTGFGYGTEAAALARMTQVGDTVVFADQGQTLTLHGARLADIDILLA